MFINIIKKNTNIFFVNNIIKNNYFINEKYNYIIGTRLHVLFFILQKFLTTD